MRRAPNPDLAMKVMASVVLVAVVFAFASWMMMWLLVTRVRADEWREGGAGTSQIDFLIQSQSSYSSQLGVILGVVAAVVYVMIVHLGRVESRSIRLTISVALALPFAYAVNLLCAGLSSVGIQVAFVIGLQIPLALSLYVASVFLRTPKFKGGVN